MVSSIDRKTKVYDLESLLTPKEVSSFVEKSRVSCGEWSTLWSSYFLGFDQGYALGKCFDCTFKIFKLLNFNDIFSLC